MNKLFSKHIFKQSVKNNWKLWAILTGVLCLFIVIITVAINSTINKIPEGIPGPGAGVTLIYAYGQMFFGTMGILLMMIYAIAVGNKLVASEVDKVTMSFTLNTPTTRKQIIFSKALFYILSIIIMAVLLGVFATVTCSVIGADIAYGSLWLIILGFVLFGLAISSICFAASCWFNKSGQSLMVGAGLPVTFWLLHTLSGVDSSLKFMKYLSINTLFDTSAIIAGSGFIGQFIALGVISVVLYTVGITKFLKKDLPL